MKLSLPVPSDVLLSPVVGLALADQQIPFAVTGAPPSEVIVPPDVADVKVISEIAAVARVGTTSAVVVDETSFPYAVPALFVA